MIISAFRVINTVPKGKGEEAKEDKNMKEKTARQIEGMKAQTFGVEIEGNNITPKKPQEPPQNSSEQAATKTQPTETAT